MAALQLFQKGYVVVPCIPNEDLVNVRKAIRHEVVRFPEFLPNSSGARRGRYVLGGFSALGNPASFHNLTVRLIREWAMVAGVNEVFGEYIRTYKTGYKLEQIIDRLLVRPIGASASAESWHRDIAVGMQPGDEVFGGWINLDNEMQMFSCVEGSHKEARQKAGSSGFAPLTKSESDKYKKDKRKVKVPVPPGYMLVFFEQLVHEVVPIKAHIVAHRLFIGWRITNATEPLMGMDSLLGKLKTQAVMPLKSGQVPPMYAKLHWTNWRDQLTEFSRGIQPRCRETQAPKSGVDKGKQYDVVHREMKSLQEYGFPTYTPYQNYEIDMHIPNREWMHLRLPGHHATWTDVSL